MKNFIGLAIFCLAISSNAFGQAKEITREYFYEPLRAVYKFDGSFRITSKMDFYKNGKLSELSLKFQKPNL